MSSARQRLFLSEDEAWLVGLASTAILISHASIAVPSLFGADLAFLFYDHLAQPGAPFIPFALFVAISMSITAFPVLMRGFCRTAAFSKRR